jgi:hypothetical protein
MSDRLERGAADVSLTLAGPAALALLAIAEALRGATP